MITIKGIKMPVNCSVCFGRGAIWCRFDESDRIVVPALPDESLEERPEWCPLVEVPDEAGNCSEFPNNSDCVSRQKVKLKLVALVNELEEIFSHVRERNEDDSVCGLCEYDGAYIGQSGDWYNECPGFDKADCFKLKDKYREEWLSIDG